MENNELQLRMKVVNYSTCPLCSKKIQRREVCIPLHNNQTVIGYAHKRCFDVVDRAMQIMIEGDEE